jgi:Arc/MetJ-type ribon-helix-helix transcriptional regulator
MNLSLKNDLKDFVREKVESGQFSSEEEVVEAALARFRKEDARGLEGFIDHEFLELCAREGDDRVTLDEVRAATARIPGSVARSIVEEERADRF